MKFEFAFINRVLVSRVMFLKFSTWSASSLILCHINSEKTPVLTFSPALISFSGYGR